jgi:hypothetical protein
MKYFDWNTIKNIKLMAERGICFEDIVAALGDGRWLDTVNHPKQSSYPGQKILIVEVNNYVFLVPFVEDNEKIFLKTIYPSRKFTIKYIERRTK